jgi:hypothetical protein
MVVQTPEERIIRLLETIALQLTKLNEYMAVLAGAPGREINVKVVDEIRTRSS